MNRYVCNECVGKPPCVLEVGDKPAPHRCVLDGINTNWELIEVKPAKPQCDTMDYGHCKYDDLCDDKAVLPEKMVENTESGQLINKERLVINQIIDYLEKKGV